MTTLRNTLAPDMLLDLALNTRFLEIIIKKNSKLMKKQIKHDLYWKRVLLNYEVKMHKCFMDYPLLKVLIGGGGCLIA